MSSELDVDGYDSIDQGEVVVLLVTFKSSIAYSYKDSFCSNTAIFLLTFFLPKSKPILLGILYRPPDKLDFVKQVKNVFRETGVLNKQERYLAGNLNINVILGEK